MTQLERARVKSLEWHLAYWVDSLTYEEILDILRRDDNQFWVSANEDIMVWQPLENLDGGYLADSIERLTEQLMSMTEEN